MEGRKLGRRLKEDGFMLLHLHLKFIKMKKKFLSVPNAEASVTRGCAPLHHEGNRSL